MIDSVLTAQSGLAGHERALKIISDNVANMNTTGYKGSSLAFSDVFLAQGDDPTSNSFSPNTGGGLDVLGTSVNFMAGNLSQTGRDLDTAISGPGFFVVQDAKTGHIFYTKNGSFTTDTDGKIVTQQGAYQVMGLNSDQSLSPIETSDLRFDAPQASTSVTFTGLLSSSDPSDTVDNIKVFDASGAPHTLSMQMDTDTTSGNGTWQVTITEGGKTLVSNQQFVILSNGPDPTAADIPVEITAADGTTTTVTFTLGPDVRTGLSSGDSSTLAVNKVDGFSAGTGNSIKFDQNGLLTVAFTNGRTHTGQQLAIAEFVTQDELTPVSGAFFQVTNSDAPMRYTAAGQASIIESGTLELSNVDLTAEFSEMVLIQRGYQASSEVLTTANEMLQDLFNMRSSK